MLGDKGWQGGRKRGEGHEFVARDAFQELLAIRAKNKKYDVVLLDPPALARTSVLSGTSPCTT
jgi:23S rRNA G2069 N7-methylase RlmK/C1962 C5-methylase RlmI